MTPEQIAVAAECMNMELNFAKKRADDVRDGVIRLSSDIRGVGSVLVGPDLSTLFYPSMMGSEEAMKSWDAGQRTPRESFAVLHGDRPMSTEPESG
ncbi:hypothetical protein CCUG60884_00910 [Mycobacteroides salmoniphilum]|uniref:Uncharacterized protein n=1 Tax=Mycobacteroides salmoniphilum TaxID=404941 RepID=A0A4R8SYK2_9MYCO|nr:hypothetical protein CCUG60884_00910 [Mycobacteroides salmoniphilum]